MPAHRSGSRAAARPCRGSRPDPAPADRGAVLGLLPVQAVDHRDHGRGWELTGAWGTGQQGGPDQGDHAEHGELVAPVGEVPGPFDESDHHHARAGGGPQRGGDPPAPLRPVDVVGVAAQQRERDPGQHQDGEGHDLQPGGIGHARCHQRHHAGTDGPGPQQRRSVARSHGERGHEGGDDDADHRERGGAVQVGGGQAEVQAEVDPVQDQHHEGRDRGHGQEAQRQERPPPRGAQEREQRRRRIRNRTLGRPGVGTDGEGDLGGGHGQPASNVRVPPSRRMQLQSGS